jgi:integrase
MTSQIIITESSLTNPIAQDQVRDFYEYTQKDKSKSSRRTYAFGWSRFTEWCNDHGYSLGNPKEVPLFVGMFLSAMAKEKKLKLASLNTYLAAIKHHLWEIMKIELDHPEIKRAMKGIRNEMRSVPKNKKKAILVEDLREILKPMEGSDKLIDIRDRALLLLGFAGGFRRSELAAIRLEHISFDRGGISVLLPWSKTDQGGQGQIVQIPFGRHEETCPVTALNRWLERGNITEGAVFRSVNRHGSIGANQITEKAVALIVKKRGGGLFNESEIAGHSLRRGLVTSALEAKAPETLVMKQTRHKSVNMLKEYYQDVRDYRNNAINSLNL